MPRRISDSHVAPLEIKRKGEPVDEQAIHSVVIEQDVDQPDMCALTLNNAEHAYSNEIALGDELEVRIGDLDASPLFSGETVGIEPTYRSDGESRCVVRAFSRLHRLLRGRRSRTFLDMKDSDVAAKIAQDNGLSASCDATGVVHAHLYQHNQTDLEFLRLCAARNGYEVVVEEKTLHFRKPRADRDSGVELVLHDSGAEFMLLSFAPRLSSAGMVQKVEVRGWDPKEKKEIVGTASASRSSLGSATGPDQAKSAFGETRTYTVDHPVANAEEAKNLAAAKLEELTMDYITGEGLALGAPEIKAGIVVKVTVNPDGRDRFNGKYFIVGASHRYRHGGGEAGGYTTAIRVRRDAEGG